MGPWFLKFLYRYRGGVLGAMGVLFLWIPPVATVSGIPWVALFLAFVLRVWARCHIGLHTRGTQWQAPFLVTSGPYAHMRHPLYLSNGLVGIGALGLHAGCQMWALGWGLLLVLLLALLARAEDQWLRQQFRNQWELWAQRVPAWGWSFQVSPSLKGRSWWIAWREDAWTWFWWVCIGVFIGWRKVGL